MFLKIVENSPKIITKRDYTRKCYSFRVKSELGVYVSCEADRQRQFVYLFKNILRNSSEL